MKKLYISVQKAYNLVVCRHDQSAILKFPYNVKYIKENNKIKITDSIPLKVLMNAITLSNLNHPEIEEILQPVDINSIVSCYLMGSVVKPKYKMVIHKYLFGLYTKEAQERVIPNDIDIMCFVNTSYNVSHIKSITSWKITIAGAYGNREERNYNNFDISFYPARLLLHEEDEGNYDFIQHIKNFGVCIMGKNIVGAKKYACWEHNTIQDKITCMIPREPNITTSHDVDDVEEEILSNRFEILDL